MAKNYTLAEAIIIAHEGGPQEDLADLGRRYPLLMAKVHKLAAKAGEEAIDLAQYFPEYLSANKVNKAIKEGVPAGAADEDADDEDDNDADETPKSKTAKAGGKPAKGKKADDDSDEDGEESKYASMSSRDLWNLLGKLNARKACEKEFGDLKKGSMVKYLEKYGEGGAPADEPEDDDEEEAAADEYTGKSAVELFKLCKQRKVKAEPKKPAKYYIDLLKKDDAAKAAEESEDDDEEWDDDEEEEAPPKKSAKTEAKKGTKAEKPAKGGKKQKAAEEDDEDDEWEI